MSLTLELVAHDLRSPLSSSRRTLERLLQEHVDGEVELLRSLLDALERIGHTVDDLLGLETLDCSAEVTAIDLEQLIDACVAGCTDPDRVDVLVVPSVVEGHLGLLKPAIMNLLDNALQHARTEVLLRAGAMDPGTLVMVEDDGPGIPPDLRELVFRPLVRLDPDAGEGAGVGLALVRRVAELHKGRAWAEGSPGGGARFCIWLP
jgi:signal transduction histidine kinase